MRPEDVIVARPPFGPTSARNALDGTVRRIVADGDERLVQVDAGLRITASVTPRAVDDLGLAEGVAVRLWVKTTALRWV